jgi:4-aminobutyrate aminotransferase-like enzyme
VWCRRVIRIAPPLVITKEQLDYGLDILDEAIGAVERTV